MNGSTITSNSTVASVEVEYGDFGTIGGFIKMSDGTFFAITDLKPHFKPTNKDDAIRGGEVREHLDHWRKEYRENSVELSVFDFIVVHLEAKDVLTFGELERLWMANEAPKFDDRADALTPLRQKLLYAQVMTKVWSLIKRWVEDV